jgi:Transcriptional regulator
MKRYNIFELLELIDDLDKVTVIEALSDTEKKILNTLSNSDYGTLTLPEIEKLTGIPNRTLRRLINKFETLGLVTSFRDAIKVIIINPAFLQKKDIYRAVRLNLLRIEKLETKVYTLENRVKTLETH